jgi:hypothetical protein
VLKLLPEVVGLIQRRLHGPMDQVLRGLQMAAELDLADAIGEQVFPLLKHPQPRVRSKAVSLLGAQKAMPPELLLGAALADTDARVRANAIEVLERRGTPDYLPVLAERARSGHNRERANALKAMHGLKVSSSLQQLAAMLQDDRPEHRVSGLWAVRQLGLFQLMPDIGRLAQLDESFKVRRYAMAVLKGMTLQQATVMEARRTQAANAPVTTVLAPEAADGDQRRAG